MLQGSKERNIKLDRKDEIGIMSQQLDGVLDKLIEAEELALEAKKTQGMFLANMSHEIRTPMNSIVGFTNLLSNTTLNIKQKQFLSNIKTNANNLLVIINDILDFSKVEAGKITLEHIVFSIKETTNQVITACEEKAALNNSKIIFEFDPTLTEWVIGDPTRLYQIVLNIVSNAVKFTKDGEIIVRIEKLNDLSDYNATIRFSVKDTGIGMTQEVASKMFESFAQASDSITRKFGGTGLGLSIVKHLVELHKGTIEVISEPGLGTTFVIDIPYACTIAPEQSNEFDQTISQEILEEFKEKNYRILLADDVEFNRTVAIETIQEWGLNIDVLEAENGIQALEIFEKEPIDLILMDIEMPEMNGYLATQKIRTELPETKRNIPIIAMSAHASHTNIQTSLSMGMNDYITKPFHHQDLFTKIIKHLVATEKETLPILELKETIREVEETKTNTQVVDVSFILEFTKGKQDRIAKMVNLFLQSTPEELNRLQHLYKEQNYKEVGTLVHSFKAKFTYMGMQQLTEIAKEIEHNTKEEKNLEHVGTLIQELVNNCDIAYNELKELLN
jgi:signal transduction histidine kinase/CheY-like chemotaxis protein/HPt (histidine-containing phosphotransfer) domain-containing protein